jgi:hypothetical protein
MGERDKRDMLVLFVRMKKKKMSNIVEFLFQNKKKR